MSEPLIERLNKILPKITADGFLSGTGLGNEISFHIFDYPPEEELHVRGHIRFLLEHIPKQRPSLRMIHIDLFDFVLGHLKKRNLLEKSIQLQQKQGDAGLQKALKGPLEETKLAAAFGVAAQPSQHDLVLVSGVGTVWPLLRSHTLLNNLQPIMGQTPLVMFYPGLYDGKSLRLFGKLTNANYYRAFKLIT